MFRTALVTGASGFIGGHLAERLTALNVHTKCLVRSTSSRERLEQCGAELVTGDVADPHSLREALAGVDVVFHLAGLTCALRRQELFRVNAEGAGNMAAACAAQPHRPVHVLVSSLAAAGPAPAKDVRREADQPQPVSHYGRSKLAGEVAARRWAHQLPTSIVRPGIVFGEHDPGMVVMAKAIRQLGIHLHAGFRSPPLAVIYARDLVEILIAVAERGERLAADVEDRSGCGIYFGAGPRYPTYHELGQLMATELLSNEGPWNIYVPGPMAMLLGAINEGVSWCRGKADIFSRDKVREGLVTSWACSCEKVIDQFKWQPSGPLEEQLRATARWYVEQKWV